MATIAREMSAVVTAVTVRHWVARAARALMDFTCMENSVINATLRVVLVQSVIFAQDVYKDITVTAIYVVVKGARVLSLVTPVKRVKLLGILMTRTCPQPVLMLQVALRVTLDAQHVQTRPNVRCVIKATIWKVVLVMLVETSVKRAFLMAIAKSARTDTII